MTNTFVPTDVHLGTSIFQVEAFKSSRAVAAVRSPSSFGEPSRARRLTCQIEPDQDKTQTWACCENCAASGHVTRAISIGAKITAPGMRRWSEPARETRKHVVKGGKAALTAERLSVAKPADFFTAARIKIGTFYGPIQSHCLIRRHDAHAGQWTHEFLQAFDVRQGTKKSAFWDGTGEGMWFRNHTGGDAVAAGLTADLQLWIGQIGGNNVLAVNLRGGQRLHFRHVRPKLRCAVEGEQLASISLANHAQDAEKPPVTGQFR